jgi:hypothetical protein
MGSFTVHRAVGASARRTWEVLTDWPRHSGTVPLTRVSAFRAPDGRAQGIGSGLVARTGVGPVAYDDRMTVTQWQPPTPDRPGRCVLRKEGHLVAGGARVVVVPVAERRCTVIWHERADVAGLDRVPFGRAVEGVVGRLVFSRALRLLARQAEGR